MIEVVCETTPIVERSVIGTINGALDFDTNVMSMFSIITKSNLTVQLVLLIVY